MTYSDYEQNLLDQIPPEQLRSDGHIARQVHAAMLFEDDAEWRCPNCSSTEFEPVRTISYPADDPTLYDPSHLDYYWDGEKWHYWDGETELHHCWDCGLVFEEAIELKELKNEMVQSGNLPE